MTGSSTVTRSARAAMCGSAKMSAAVYAVATGTSHATQRSSMSRASSELVQSATIPLIVSPFFGPIRKLGEPRIVEQVGPVHRLAQAREVGVGAGDDAHVLAVERGVVVERRRVREPVALARPHDAEAVVRGERPLENAERGAVERGVDHRARSAARVACVQRADRGLGREHAGEVVGDRHADAHRRTIGIAGEMQQAAVADADAVETRPGRVRTVLAEHRDAHGDEARVEIVRADVPLLERAGAKVLDEDVGGCREAPQEVLAFGACGGRA